MKKLGVVFALICAIAFSAIATASVSIDGFNAPNSAEHTLTVMIADVKVDVANKAIVADFVAVTDGGNKERFSRSAVELTIANIEKESSLNEVGWRMSITF